MTSTATTPTRRKTPPQYRVGIVEDHTFMQEGMRVFVDSLEEFECVWVAASAAEAMEKVGEDAPHVLIVDITLPDRSGLELIKDLHATHSGLAVLVISMHEEDLYAERALKAGARGYLMKNAPHDVFESALLRVAQGGVAVSHKMSDRVLMAFSSGVQPRPDSGLHNLSDREFEVFQHLGEGKSTHQVAEVMRISPKTVDVHRMNIKNKLLLEDGAAVTRYAIRWAEARKHGGAPPEIG